MKKATITGARQAALIDAPEPKPVGDFVLVKVHAAPMCAEYKQFLSGDSPGMMGHEAAGEVVAVAQPGHVQVGDRVVAMPLASCGTCPLCLSGDYIYCENGTLNLAAPADGADTMAQYLLKPSWLLPKIPEGVSYERASLACCAIGPSFGAFQTMNLNAFDTVLITGLGPVGLGAIVNARFRGARVLAVEKVPYRVARAQELGAEQVFDPQDPDVAQKIKEATGGRGVDCALDCSGTVAAERLCIDAARRKGRVAFVGECYNDLPIRVSPDMIRKGLTLIGSWHYNLADFPKVMQVIQQSPLVDRLISHIIPMSRIQEAFEVSASNQTAKVILKPWE
jgi:L-iditol 2-dehydrogenase